MSFSKYFKDVHSRRYRVSNTECDGGIGLWFGGKKGNSNYKSSVLS